MEAKALYKKGDLLVSRGRKSTAEITFVSPTHYLFTELNDLNETVERHWEHTTVEKTFVNKPAKVQTTFWVAVYVDGSVSDRTFPSEEAARKASRKRHLHAITQFGGEISTRV